MSHWRSILFGALTLLLLGREISPAPQIQGQPVSVIYNLSTSSYDSFNKYANGALLNGLNLGNVSHLGAQWSRSRYVDRNNAFGVLSYDTMFGYVNGAVLTGLNLGNNWFGPYVDRTDYYPGLTFDTMASYVNAAPLNGLNGGGNNGSPAAVWGGAYADSPCVDLPPTLIYTGGVVIAAITVMGYDTILMTFDGTTPTTGAVVGPTTATTYNGGVAPAGTYTYAGALALPWNCTVKATQGHGIMGFCAVNSLISALSFGDNWSLNVQGNGGATPSGASITAINQMGASLNNDNLLTQSLGAVPSIYHLNVIAPDSLIAASTPQIYYFGSVLWVNHGPFVSGDLTVNGITGDASTKYFDTGFNPSLFNLTFLGQSFYAYAASGLSANGFDGGSQGTSDIIGVQAKHGANTVTINGSGAQGIVTASPGNGFYEDDRTASNVRKAYFASSGSAYAQIGATDANAFTAYPNFTCWFMALDNQGSINAICDDTISGMAYHVGFTLSDGAKLFTDFQAVRTAFGGGFR